MNLLERIEARARKRSMIDLHPELFNGTMQHLTSIRSDEAPAYQAYSYLAALSDHAQHVWVRKAVKVIADNLAPLPVKVVRGQDEIDTHPAKTVLTDVNDQLSSADLWRQWAVDLLLGGEEGWELVRSRGGGYAEIWPRQPHAIHVIPDRARLAYYGVAGYKIDLGLALSGMQPFELPPEEFTHFKFYNPQNPWRGLSIISAVRSAILIDTFAQAWSKGFLRKNARPDYAIITGDGMVLTQPERDEIEAKLMAKYGGTANAGKPIVLDAAVKDVKPLDFRPKDLEWVAQREMSREEIGAMFGVPDEIMGWGRDTYENFDTAHRVFFSLTVVPLAGFRDIALTEDWRRKGLLRPDESLVTDFAGTPALQENFGEKIEQAARLWGLGVPFNTLDEKLSLGIGAIPGGERGYLPLALVPLMAGGQRLPEAGGQGSNGAGEQGPKQIGTLLVRALPAPVKTPAFGSDEHEKLWNAFVKRIEPHERRLGDVVADLMERQREEVLAKLRRPAKTAREAAEDPFDRDEWEDTFGEEVRPVLRATVRDAGEAALADLAVGISFDLFDPRVVEFLQGREQRFAGEVNETTWQALKDSLADGLEAGETIPQLAERVEAVMGDRIRSSKTTIARTEVVGASNGGTLEAWRQSGVVERKQWLAALDDRTRPEHESAHGQTVDLDEEFEVGGCSGDMPGNTGCADMDINCRCTATTVVAERSVRAIGLRAATPPARK